jgi:hypothetical protein
MILTADGESGKLSDTAINGAQNRGRGMTIEE